MNADEIGRPPPPFSVTSVTPRRRTPRPHLPLPGIHPLRLQPLLAVAALPAALPVRHPLQALCAPPPAGRDVPVVEPARVLLPVAPAQVLLVERPVVVAAVVLAAERPRAHGAVAIRGRGGRRRGRGRESGGRGGGDALAPLAAAVVAVVPLDRLLVHVLYVPVEVGGPLEGFLPAALVEAYVLW